jgi:hypothetical protein
VVVDASNHSREINVTAKSTREFGMSSNLGKAKSPVQENLVGCPTISQFMRDGNARRHTTRTRLGHARMYLSRLIFPWGSRGARKCFLK